MSNTIKEYIYHGKIVLDYLDNNYEYIQKITMLVQNNQKFFDDPVAGSQTLMIAAYKLETLIDEWKQFNGIV